MRSQIGIVALGGVAAVGWRELGQGHLAVIGDDRLAVALTAALPCAVSGAIPR